MRLQILLAIGLIPRMVLAETCAPPVFYTSLPRDQDWYYGVGRNPDTNSARDEAVRNLGKQVTGAVDGWDARQIETIAGPGRIRRDVDAAVGSALESTPLGGWEQDDFWRCAGQSYVLVRIEKDRAVRFLKENAAFRSAFAARLENRMAGLETNQEKQDDRLATLEQTVRGLTKMLEQRDADIAKPGVSWKAGVRVALKKDAETCAEGKKSSCYSLGARYLTGMGAFQDKSKAQLYFRKACEHGDGKACAALGALYDDGSGAEDLKIKATEYFQKACDLDDGDGCDQLGKIVANGYGIHGDRLKAMELHRKACDLDSGQGCFSLGLMYEMGTGFGGDAGARQNAKRLADSAEFYSKACDLGAGDGCTRLAYSYRYGRVLAKDPAKALELSIKGCDLGDGIGCHDAAEMYGRGEGVAATWGKYFEFSVKGCDRGNRYACGDLAYLYLHGEGVPQDLTKGALCYQKACDAYTCYGRITRAEVRRLWPALDEGKNK